MDEEKWSLEKIGVSRLTQERKSGENTVYEDVAVVIVYRKGIDVKVVHPPILKGTLARVGPGKFKFYLTWDSCLSVLETVYDVAKIKPALTGKMIWIEINEEISRTLLSKNP